jgi:uncharacterized protein YfbU (UPF0304 family)
MSNTKYIVRTDFVGSHGNTTTEYDKSTSIEWARMKYTRSLERWATILCFVDPVLHRGSFYDKLVHTDYTLKQCNDMWDKYLHMLIQFFLSPNSSFKISVSELTESLPVV